MRLLVVAALLACAFSKGIEFAQDTNSASALGIFTKGFFDPTTSGESKIESFLRLANELIPLAEAKGRAAEQHGSRLGYSRYYCTGSDGDLFNACFYASAELWIGWYVWQNGTYLSNEWQVSYTPFTFLRAGVNVSVESYPAEVGYGAYVSVVDITIPLNGTVGQERLCYYGNFNFAPGSIYTQITTALLECYWDLTPVSGSMCNKVYGPNFEHLEYLLWDGYQNSFLPNTCFNYNSV